MEEDTRTGIFSKDSENTSLPRYVNQSRGGNGDLGGRRYENHGHGHNEEQGGAWLGARERAKRRGEVKRRAPWRLESRFQIFHRALPDPSLCWNDAELRWSTHRANDRYKDHLYGQLTNYFMTMMTLNWKDPSTLRRNHEKTGKQMNNSETVSFCSRMTGTWQLDSP